MDKIVIFKAKNDSALLRLAGILIRPINPRWARDYWITIGNTIYYPPSVTDPMAPQYATIRAHELEHVWQFRRYGFLIMLLGYFLLPLPVLFSGRWLIERRAFLKDIRAKARSVDGAVDTLWYDYAAPWPRGLMRRWFNHQLNKED
jgi:hypothetical protein